MTTDELERNLKLEKVVDSEQLRLVVETEEERRASMENDAATKWLRLALEMDGIKTGEDSSYRTAHVSPD